MELLWLFQGPRRHWAWSFFLAGTSVFNLHISQWELGALAPLIDSQNTGICCLFNEMENIWIFLIWLAVVIPLLWLAPALQYFNLFYKQEKKCNLSSSYHSAEVGKTPKITWKRWQRKKAPQKAKQMGCETADREKVFIKRWVFGVTRLLWVQCCSCWHRQDFWQ